MGDAPPGPLIWSSEMAARWRTLAQELRRRLGPGEPLDATLRHAFEARLGTDVTRAVLHQGRLAGGLAAALHADALTVGGHVLGDASQLDHRTAAGTALLGHELTHAAGAVGAAGSARGAVARRLPADQVGLQLRPPFRAPRPTQPPIVQRSDGDGGPGAAGGASSSEATAAAVERALLRPETGQHQAPIDVEVLAARVYDRLKDAIQLERERAAQW
jgi:hypothetical protein